MLQKITWVKTMVLLCFFTFLPKKSSQAKGWFLMDLEATQEMAKSQFPKNPNESTMNQQSDVLIQYPLGT